MGHKEPHQAKSASEAPCSDASWRRRCGPLLVFLAIPRDWGELTTWASERGMSGCRLRNMLAWLEGEGMAGAFEPRDAATPERGRDCRWRGYAPRALH